MQVDGEILFANKGPVMVKESEHFQNCLFRGQYLSDKGHLKVKNGPKPYLYNIIPLNVVFLGVKFYGNIIFYIRGQHDVLKVKVIWESF